MTDEHDHKARVDAWRRRVGEGHPAATLITAFERAFRGIWASARVPLGDITLLAIGDRVLYDAVERYPALCLARLEAAGVTCEDLLADSPNLEPDLLDEGLQLVLVELLTVLGRLTGEVLTPMLHAALAADRFLDDEDSAS